MFSPFFIPSTAHRITISKPPHCEIINNKRFPWWIVRNTIAALLFCTYYACTVNEKGATCLDENAMNRMRRRMPAKKGFIAASKTV